MRNSRRGFSPVIIVLVLFIIFLTGFFFAVTSVPEFKNSIKNPFVPPPTPTGDGNKITPLGNFDGVNAPIPNLNEKKTWKILRKDATGSAVVAEFDPNNYGSKFVRWNNLLIYGKNTDDDSQIVVYDFVSRETKIVYDKNKSGDFSDKRSVMSGIGGLTIIGDELYFSLGGYIAPGATYWVSLPDFDKINLLAKTDYGIKKIRDHYFLTNGFGDGCGGYGEHSLFDLATKKFSLVEHSEFGCSGGEEFVGIDASDRIIMVGHEPDSGQQDDFRQVYTYVLTKPLSNPDQKNGLISKQDMPKGVTTLENLEKMNRLILISDKSVWFFDLNNDKLSKVGDLPVSKINIVDQKTDAVCLYQGQNDFQFGARIDLTDGKLSADRGDCDEKTTVTYSKPQTFEEFKKQLKLSEGYEAVEE